MKSDINQFVFGEKNDMSTMPKASRIRELIKSQILNGTLPDGCQLLPMRQLADFYGVSYLTVSHALDQLEQENLILRVHGRGVFVNWSPAERDQKRFRILLIYHGRDAITPLFIDQLFNFFCARHDDLTLLEMSVLDGLSPEERQEKLRQYLDTPADMLIADGSYYLPFREIDKFRGNFRKIVFFNRYESDYELINASKILYDYREAGRCAAQALLAEKRRNVVYIAPDSAVRRKYPPYGPEVTYHWQMRAGLSEVLAGAGAELRNLIIKPDSLESSLEELLKSFKPDAFFAFHDYCALKVNQLLALPEFRKKVKGYSICGCFNTDVSRKWVTPGLSTINFNADLILDELKKIIAGDSGNSTVMIQPEFIRRDSMCCRI